MAFDNSLFQYDAGYYEYIPGSWLPGKIVPKGFFTCSKEAIHAALEVDLDDSDVLVATYPKTGNIILIFFLTYFTFSKLAEFTPHFQLANDWAFSMSMNRLYVVRRRGRLAPRQPPSVCALLPAYEGNRHLRPPGNLGHHLRRPRWID